MGEAEGYEIGVRGCDMFAMVSYQWMQSLSREHMPVGFWLRVLLSAAESTFCDLTVESRTDATLSYQSVLQYLAELASELVGTMPE